MRVLSRQAGTEGRTLTPAQQKNKNLNNCAIAQTCPRVCISPNTSIHTHPTPFPCPQPAGKKPTKTNARASAKRSSKNMGNGQLHSYTHTHTRTQSHTNPPVHPAHQSPCGIPEAQMNTHRTNTHLIQRTFDRPPASDPRGWEGVRTGERVAVCVC